MTQTERIPASAAARHATGTTSETYFRSPKSENIISKRQCVCIKGRLGLRLSNGPTLASFPLT